MSSVTRLGKKSVQVIELETPVGCECLNLTKVIICAVLILPVYVYIQ
jgi:hypothetical protein